MKSYKKFTLDMHEMISDIVVDVKRGEVGRVLEITLAEDGKPLEIPSNSTIGISDNVSIASVTLEDNVVTYEFDGTTFNAAEGKKWLELRIVGADGTLLYTSRFVLNVYAALDEGDEAAAESPSYSLLNDLLVELTAFKASGYFIDSIVENADTSLTITLENANGDTQTVTTSTLKGAQGEQGVGVSSITTTTSGKAHAVKFNLSNGASYSYTVYDGEDGATGADGADGADGRGIVSIAKTGTVGLVDTYTITYSDGTTSTYTVTNGADGQGGGGGGSGIDTLVLVYKASPSASETAANIDILANIFNHAISGYRVFIRVGADYIAAAHIEKGTSGVTVISSFTADTDSLKYYVFTYELAQLPSDPPTYTQSVQSVPGDYQFDDTSNGFATMAQVAEYVDDALGDIATAISQL